MRELIILIIFYKPLSQSPPFRIIFSRILLLIFIIPVLCDNFEGLNEKVIRYYIKKKFIN